MVVCTMIKHGGDLHNYQTFFDIKIYRREHLELKLESNYPICAHTIYHKFLFYFCQVLKEGVKRDDLNEVAKLFNIHAEATSDD